MKILRMKTSFGYVYKQYRRCGKLFKIKNEFILHSKYPCVKTPDWVIHEPKKIVRKFGNELQHIEYNI